MAKYTQQQLSDAFDKVKNQKDWKAKVQKVIDAPSAQEKDLIEQAIIHFTGSVPYWSKVVNGKVKVFADGYYEMEAALGMF